MPGTNTFGSAYLGQYSTDIPVAYTLSASAGSFVETGNAASFLRGYVVAATAGAFVFTGKAIAFLRGYVFTTSKGTFTFTFPLVGPVVVHGTTKDAGGLPLAGALVEMFRADTDVFVTSATSHADGTFLIEAPVSLLLVNVWMRAWRADTPQIAGTSCTETLQQMAA